MCTELEIDLPITTQKVFHTLKITTAQTYADIEFLR